MIKLHASYSKKIPGSEQYSSESASASVEIELPEGANIPSKLAELWRVTRAAVEHQLGQRQPQPVNRVVSHVASSGGNGNDQHAPSHTQHAAAQGNSAYTARNGNNGNGRSRAAMSDKQRGFVKSLIGEMRPLGVDYAFVENLCQRLFQRGLDVLDRAQGSTLIGHLSEIKAGRVTVEQLAS